MNVNKRQKVPTVCEQPRDLQGSVSHETHRSYTLDTLPPEVLEMILRLLPLQDVGCTVRLVSRHCLVVATAVLNGAFLGAGTRLEILGKCIEKRMSNAKTDTELLAYSRACNALELIRTQYKMLKAVTWRYTHPPSETKFPRLCFYAGSLLDDLNGLLRRASNYPATFVGPHIVDSSITCFVAVCKRFMNFFEKVSERRVNRSALVSGCKVVDVLDCLIEGRKVLSFKVMPGRGLRNSIVTMKLKYVLKRAWFTCLEVPKHADENSWRDEQRFMYLRLRRLVGSVNEHFLENLHYELLLQAPLMLPLRPPPASTYSGYGEYGGQFFYYGNMNKYAYESKFKLVNTSDVAVAGFETEEEVYGEPCFDLVIEIDLRCSPELAPLAVRPILKSDEFENFTAKTCKQQELLLKMNIVCPASAVNRLPSNFTWELRSPRRVRSSS